MRIPGGDDLGQRVAQPPNLTGAGVVNPAAFGQAPAAGLARMGDEMQRREAHEAQRMRAESEEQTRVWDAAQKASAMDVLQRTRDDLAALHDDFGDGVRTGRIGKDKAGEEWGQQSRERIGAALENVPVTYRQQVQRDLDGRAASLARGVTRAVVARNRADVTASLDSILESEARTYGRDAVGSTARVNAAIASLGPNSDYQPDQLARKGQAWLEGAQFTTAFGAVTAAREDPKALAALDAQLKNPDYLASLDPQRRATLLDRVNGYRLHHEQQAELRAQRAAREAERVMRKAEAEFNAFQALADKGGALSTEYVDRAIAATAGTPYQQGIRALAQQARETGGIAAHPIAAQRAALANIDAFIATNGRTPELDKRRGQIEGVLKAAENDVQADPMRAAAERGVLARIEPLDLSGGIQGLASQLGSRSVQADVVRQWAGKPSVSPFTADEAQQVGRLLRAAPADQQGQAIAALSQALPPHQTAALAAQIDKADRPLALAMAAGADRTTQGRTTAELILRGAQAIKDKSIKEEKGAEFGVRAQIAKTVGDALAGNDRESVIDAARLIYLGEQAAGETVTAESAVRLALHGDIVEHNGRRIPVAVGVDAASLGEKLRRLPRQQVEAQAPDGYVYLPGGRPMGVPEFLASLPDAQLEPAGHGKYMVRSGGSLVMNASRQPIVVEAR